MTRGPVCGRCGQWARAVVGDGSDHPLDSCFQCIPRQADPGDVVTLHITPGRPDVFVFGWGESCSTGLASGD